MALGWISGGAFAAAIACASPVFAQSANYTRDLNSFPRAAPPPPVRYVEVLPGQSFAPAVRRQNEEVVRTAGVRDGAPYAAATQDVWFEGADFTDRMSVRRQGRLTRADGGPLPGGPMGSDALSAEDFDVTYIRGWSQTLARSEDGVELAIEPHAGVEIGNRGGAAVAGATVRIGRDLENLVADGDEAFGDRPRWYVYAAGSGRAVGYNWARGRDGDFNRSGLSQDEGAYLGDASVGVAMRRGPVHGSLGVVYREVEIDGLRGYGGMSTDVSEGLVAFQLSIKP